MKNVNYVGSFHRTFDEIEAKMTSRDILDRVD